MSEFLGLCIKKQFGGCNTDLNQLFESNYTLNKHLIKNLTFYLKIFLKHKDLQLRSKLLKTLQTYNSPEITIL